MRPGPGVIAGAVQGYMLGQLPGAIGGTVGSFVGSGVVGKKTDSTMVKAAAGALVGAGLSAATQAGLSALAGAGASVPALVTSAISGGLAGLTGTLAAEAGGMGVMSGGIQGFIANRTPGLAAGGLGGFVGIRVGEKTGSTEKAVLAGAASGAAIGAAAVAGFAALAGQNASVAVLTTSALMGGFAGAVGTLSGSKRAAPRDAVYGGALAGMMAATYTGSPALGIATAAAAGYAGRAKTPIGQAVVGSVIGAVAGGIAGAPLGLQGAAISALAGAIATPVGSIAGTTFRQVMRNAQVDLVNGINNKLDPYLEKNPLSHNQKLLAGAVAGGVTLGVLGGIAGWQGTVVMGAAGMALGAYQTHKLIKTVEHEREVTQAVVRYTSIPGAFDGIIEEQKRLVEEAQRKNAA